VAAFSYTAIAASGERRSGVLAAADEQSALAELDRLSLTPISLRATSSSAAATSATPRRTKSPGSTRLATFYTQLADLLRAGVPLLRGLRVLTNAAGKSPLQPHIAGLADAVQDGKDLASAMTDRGVFPSAHVAMVRAGEKGGFLEAALSRLGKLVEAQAAMRSKVIGSLIYPCVVAVFGTIIVLALAIFLLPQFKSVFDEIELPWITQLVFGASDVISELWWLVVLVFLAAGLTAWFGVRNTRVRGILARIPLKIPVVRGVLHLLAVGRFARVLGTLLGAGVPMLGALEIAKEAGGLAPLADAATKAAEEVRAGRSLADPLQASGLFPTDVLEMVRVGEAANNLDDVLVSAADTLDSRLDRQLGTAVRLIEPATLLVLGLIIAVIAMALILPMMRLTSGMGVN